MNHVQTISKIETGRVIAILRGDFKGHELDMVTVMLEGGLSAVEVTLNSPNALGTIEKLAGKLGTRCAVGAGTVLTSKEVEQVAAIGGTFIVSPNCDPLVIHATKQRGLVSLPGAFTPTEIVTAMEAGADAVKVFPATTLGPGYVKAILAPLPNARLVPTGGVTAEMARQYVQSGAWAVGAGSELIGKGVFSDESSASLLKRTADFVQAMKL